MATTPVDPRINSTTMYLPGAGFLAQTGQATPAELAAASGTAAPNNSAAYLPGGQVTYPGGTSPINTTQFATQTEADRLAQLYGGTASTLQLQGPGYGWTPQQQLNIPGAPSQLNAGLVSNTLYNSPGAYGQYLVNRDATGNYGPSAYDTHRNMDTMEATAKAYGWGPEMRVQQGLPAQAPTTQTTTPTAPTTRLSSSQIAAGQNPYLTAPTTRTPTTQTQTMNLTRTPYRAPGTTPAANDPYQQALMDNGMTSNALSRGYVRNIPPATDGGTQTTQGADVNYLDPNTEVPAPASGTIFQGSDGTFYSWNGSGWDQSETPPPGAVQQDDGSWTYGNETTNEGTLQGPPPTNTGGGGTTTTGGGGGGGTTSGGVGQGFVSSGQYTPGSAWIPGGPTLPTGGGAYATNPYGTGSSVYPMFTQQDTPEHLNEGEGLQYKAENDRAMAIQQGLGLQGDFSQYVNTQQGRANAYEGAANTAYEGIANGYGGYSDQEKAAIQQNAYLHGLQLTPEEMQGIQGDPWRAYQQLGTDEGYMGDAMNSWYGAVGGAIGEGDAGINNALNDAGTNVRNSVYNQRTAMRNDLSDIAALTRDQQDQAVGNVRGALDYGEDYTRQYINPDKLTWSPEYQQNYNVTEQDMQDIRNKAGRSVGAQEAMDEQNLERQANAQGNTSPLAIQAARDRMRQTGAVNEADAMSDAQIKAKQLQLQTTQARENTRLGAETAYANLGTGSELALGARRTGAEQQLGAQGLSNEQYMGNASLGTETTLGAAEQGAEQYLGQQQQQARQFQSSQKVAAQNTLGAANTAQEQWKTGTNLAAGQQAEGAQQARAGQIAGNRQQTGQYIYGQTAQNNTNFANQRLTAEQEYRNYLSQMHAGANQNVTVGNQQRLGGYQAQTGAQNASTGTAIVNYKTPSATEKILGGIAGIFAKGGVIKGPQKALVGEAGPELIIDLEKQPDEGGDMKHTYGIPHYGEGFDPFGSDSDNPGSPAEGGDVDPFGKGSDNPQEDTMTGPRAPKKKLHPDNPLYAAIKKRTYGKFIPEADDAAQPADSSGSFGGKGTIGSELVKTGVKSLAKFLLAGGGVAMPHAMSPKRGMVTHFGKPNTGHHPYGRKGMPKMGVIHPKGPKIEYVSKPKIMTLGSKVPQAVVPMTRRPGNKINIEDIPNLMSKYGV